MRVARRVYRVLTFNMLSITQDVVNYAAMNPGAQEDSIPQALSRARLLFSSDSSVDCLHSKCDAFVGPFSVLLVRDALCVEQRWC